MKKLVIWDVDGTLLDTSEGLISSTRYMISELGLDMPSDDVLYSFVGPRIQDSLERVYGIHGEQLSHASAVFREHYKKGDVFAAIPYYGIEDVLKKLREVGIHMAVATNKRQDFVDALLSKFGFDKYMDYIAGTDMAGKYTKTDLINICIKQFPYLTNDDAIMIGDSDYDAIAANEAGLDFLGVTYGFGFKRVSDIERYKPLGVARDVYDIFQFLVDNAY